jgi:hypothetical protein
VVYRILSIDGGGIRGLVPALVLAELEDRAKRPVADLFDLVAGTSTGALLALALLRPGAGNRPQWSAQEVAVFYEARGPRIFARTPWRELRTLSGYLGPRYAARALEGELDELFGDTMLSSALCDVIVTSYDLRSRRPYLFTSDDVRASRTPDQPMRLVARCSAAAPTYFAPGRLGDGADEGRWLVDGGVFANNPAMSAYAAARQERPADELVLMSVGTGALTLDYATTRLRRGGALVWSRPLFTIVLDGQEDVTDLQLRQLVPDGRYYRFQADLEARSEHIDDTGSSNLRALRDRGSRLIERSSADLDAVVALLADAPEKASL